MGADYLIFTDVSTDIDKEMLKSTISDSYRWNMC